MNWNNGFTARYNLTKVDPTTWRDDEAFPLVSGQINKGTEKLMETADIVLTTRPGAGEVWVRIWLDARQGDSGEHVAIFTGLLQTPESKWRGLRREYNAECSSVLKPADDILLPRGWYAMAGTNGAQLAASLLTGWAPVECDEGAPALTEAIIAEDRESNLTMAQKLVEAIGWRIRIAGDGRIRICPKATEASARFDSVENDILELELTDSQDWFSCPNVFRATSGNLTATARDEYENSPLSIQNRGREIWKAETGCILNENESIAEYAFRRLAEEQAPSRTINYTRRFRPNVVPGDVVQIHYPAQGVEGDFRITQQRIELGYAARTAEESVEA